MNRIRPLIFFSIIYAFGFSGIFISSCKRKSFEGSAVFTEVNGKYQDPNLSAQESKDRDIQARISVINGKSGSQPLVLTQGFYSARSPEISGDGTRILFSAMQKKGDKWQIWELDLSSSDSRMVTNLPANCFDPVYLPNGRVLFSRQDPGNDSVSALASCNSDGTDLMQITFNPYDYSASSILKDGRVLAVSRMTGTSREDAGFMVLRPDGTKNELFYKGPESSHLGSRGCETEDGKIVFIESDNSKEDRSDLISIDYKRPLHSCSNLSSAIEGKFASVFPLKSGKLLVSYRKSPSERYGLCEFDPAKKEISQVVYSSNDYDIIEIVAVVKHERSKKLPSEVDMGVKTGLILCQDVNYHGFNASVDTKLNRVNKIRVMGKDSTLGEIDVEKDGSFYLKVIADTPFRIQTIDDKGNIVGKPCEWIYLRPNERRGCIGCHEDHEMVPDNKVSLAVKHEPFNIPVHISKVAEKKVSLE